MSPQQNVTDLNSLFAQAVALSQRGALAQAEALCRQILADRPDHFPALHLAGELAYHQEKLTEARDHFMAALALEPRQLTILSGLGLIHLRLGDCEAAVTLLDRALAENPDHLTALNNRGNALLDLQRFEEALADYDRVLVFQPSLAQAHYNRGNALSRLERFDAALAAYDRTLLLHPAYAEAWHNRGNVLRALQRPNEALASYDRALALKPDTPDFLNDKGLVLSEIGRLKEAEEGFEKAIRLQPARPIFYAHLASIRKFRSGDAFLEAMQSLSGQTTTFPQEERTALHFALGKALADSGDHDNAFGHFIEGNGLKRAINGYDEALALDIIARTQKAFTAAVIAAGAQSGDPSQEPIFILGMPRSGSTLIEQTLASHPLVHGAGEINDFARAAAQVAGPAASPELLAHLSEQQVHRIGRDYGARLKKMAPQASRITDKMLDNFRLIGLIHMALPNARILHTRRDPLDICVSCFSKLFEKNNLPFTYDLAELGRYYRAYEGLMEHWRRVLPQNVMLDLQYEEIIADFEGKAREILAFCGLDWDPRCLAFHETERPVRTASQTQVREPLFKSSVGRWRVYEKHLGPLLDALGQTS